MSTVELKFNDFVTFDNSQLLKEFRCSYCNRSFTERDINERNYCLGISDWANELSKDTNCGLTKYNLTFWLKSVEHQQCPLNSITDFTFSYDLVNNTCYFQEKGEIEQELTIKGDTNQGGTWFQIGNLTYHWISFHR